MLATIINRYKPAKPGTEYELHNIVVNTPGSPAKACVSALSITLTFNGTCQ